MQNRDTKNNKKKNKKKDNEGHFLTHCALRISNKKNGTETLPHGLRTTNQSRYLVVYRLIEFSSV